MKQIYFIRHAQSESNAGTAIRPNQDIQITNLGKSQADELANWLIDHISQPIDDIFVSKYLRTAQTAEPFLTKLNRQATVIDDLHEFNYFDFHHIKALSFSQLVEKANNYWQNANKDFQDSENTDSFLQFIERVKNVRQFLRQLPDGCYVVFTHGMWIGMLMWQLLHKHGNGIENMRKFREFEMSVRPKNCEVFLMTIDTIETIAKVRTRQEVDSMVEE